jgi:NADH-quinone oxidoreductase subunit J
LPIVVDLCRSFLFVDRCRSLWILADRFPLSIVADCCGSLSIVFPSFPLGDRCRSLWILADRFPMSPPLFWIFSFVMLAFGAMVVVNRNPVASALSLVVSFLALAALYVSLGAFFIGVIQILVYAGAVMVLFLFIIMLLDLKAEARRRLNFPATCGGAVVIALFVKVLFDVCYGFEAGKAKFPLLSGTGQSQNDIWQIGMTIFQQYNLPLQVVGVLLLVATIGVVLLSKRELR